MEIHAIRGRRANSYLIEEADRLLVIDVAFLGDGEVIAYLTDTLGRKPEEVEIIVCTHGHGDHLGGVASLAARCDAEVYIPPLTDSWRHRFFPAPGRWLAWMFGRRQHAARPLSAGAIRRLSHGGTVPRFPNWRVIHTPGHTDDSCCYFHAGSGTLVTGDTILGSGRTGRLVLPAFYRDLTRLKQSIESLRELQPRAVYPGHGSSLRGEDLFTDLIGELSTAS